MLLYQYLSPMCICVCCVCVMWVLCLRDLSDDVCVWCFCVVVCVVCVYAWCSLVPRPPPFLPSVCVHNNTRNRKISEKWKPVFAPLYYCKRKWKVCGYGETALNSSFSFGFWHRLKKSSQSLSSSSLMDVPLVQTKSVTTEVTDYWVAFYLCD